MISSILLLNLLFKREDKLATYIYSVAIWMLVCFGMTEILSIVRLINFKTLWICWILVTAILILLNVIKYRKSEVRYLKLRLYKRSVEKGYLVVAIFFVIMLMVAVKTVPYNWDSMTYHLPRVFHWAQNGSVGHYATAISRQVSSPLGGAYVALHVYVMSGKSDRFLNLLQCCSFLTNSVLVYGIAKKIGCSKKYCYMAMLLFCSMPIAFAEAFTTQVDNFAALWMLSTVYLLIDLLRRENRLEWSKNTYGRVVILSFCVTFGYLTKPSVGIGMLFFAIWLLIVVIRRKDRIIPILIYLFTAFVIMMVLLAPGIARNIATYDALSAPEVGQRQLIGTLKPQEVMVNCVKNLTFNMPAIWIYDSSTMLYNGVNVLADMLEVDIDNPTIAEDGRAFVIHDVQEYDHDTAINPIIVYLLIIFAVIGVVKRKKNYLDEMGNRYFRVTGLAFVAFCAILRWEPFVSRYMISYLAILSPAIAWQAEKLIEQTTDRKNKEMGIWLKTLIYFLCFTELFGVLVYHSGIALSASRYEGYFINRTDIEESYRKTADIINCRDCENIGILTGINAYEYPLTVMLKDYCRIEHVNVENATAKYEDKKFVPEIIVAVDYMLEDDTVFCHGVEYEVTEVVDDYICLLERTE